ncbi:MAG: hypothetical protein WC810_25175, partial [Janthinobacterium sp.]
MGIENGRSSIETVLEDFKTDLSSAGDFAKQFGARIPLKGLPSFEKLVGHEGEMMEVLFKHVGIDPNDLKVVKEYSMTGAPETSGEGEIKVRVIMTND